MNSKSDSPRLKRPKYQMPDFVQEALETSKLLGAYQERPPYQRNDYIGWITQAKQQTTKMKRLQQMLDELEQGDIYMKMAYQSNKKLEGE